MRKKKQLPELLQFRDNTFAEFTLRNIKELSVNTFAKPSVNQGSVLVITIWIVSILVLFVIGLSALISGRLSSFKYFRDMNRAYLIASGSVTKAIAELNKETSSSHYDTLSEPWSNNPEAFQGIKLGGGIAEVSYQFPQPDGNAPITFYGSADEERRININKAGPTTLQNLLMKVAGLDTNKALSLANCIMDWRDNDTVVRPSGAEDNYYSTLSPPYLCKNQDFEVAEELLLVKGMTLEIYSKIKDTITVYGSGKVNINTAPVNTLLALELPYSLTSKIYHFRKGNDGIIGTEDDNVITEATELVMRLGMSEPLSPEDSVLLNNLIVNDLITVESKYYRITARGSINNKTRQIICIVERGGPIVFWQEH